jgi:predicted ATPase
MVGRETELAKLHGWLEKALRGERQVVFVTGEPGIGKTSVVQAFLAGIRQRGTDNEEQTTTDRQGATGNGQRKSTDLFQPMPDARSPVPGVWLGWGQCIGHYGVGEPYLPVLEALGRLCRGTGGDCLIALLNHHAPTWLVQMPALLGAPELEVLQRKTQGATRERMLRELAEALEAITAEHPLILVLEDLHWSDPSTLDLLSVVARRTEAARLLVIGAYRPVDVIMREHPLKTVKAELQLHQHCQELALEPLSEAQVAEYLVRRWEELSRDCEGVEQEPLAYACSSDSLDVLARLIHQRTEGNPLFVVSVVDDLMTRGVVVQTARGWELQGDAVDIENRIPDTIRQLMNLQRNRLTSAEQQTLAAASVVGLEFSAAAVAAALTTETAEIERQCEHLAEQHHWLRRLGVDAWPDGTLAARYGFVHAVYQQAWHERVNPTQLQQYHLRIGERKERGYGERSGDIAVELAVHFEQGREYAKAVQYYGQAAQNAFHRHALPEVMAHVATGLSLLDKLPATPERHQQELMLQMLLGAALLTTKSFAAPEVGRVYARALALCRQLEESPQLFPVLFGLALFYTMQGQLKTAVEIEDQLQHLVQHYANSLHCVEVHFVSGLLSFTRGELISAHTSLGRSLALYEPQQASAHILMYGQDPGVASGMLSAFICWLRGYPKQAVTQTQAVLTLARESAHPYTLSLALFWAAQVYQLLGKVQTVQAYAGEMLPFAQAHGIANGLSYGMVLHGWALAEQGQVEEGLVRIHEGLAILQDLGIKLGKDNCLAWLAETYRKAGQFAKGLQVLAEALNAGGKAGERWYEAELCRLKGELTLQQFKIPGSKFKAPNPQHPTPNALSPPLDTQHLTLNTATEAEAEACFLKAIDIARRQQAKSWELRATMSLARLWQQQGKANQAHTKLSEIYIWFTEGFDTKDLQEARVLLRELS